MVLALLLVAVMHIGARKRQIGALRAFGAPVRSIMAIVWGELFFLLLLGIFLGLALGYAVAHVITSWLTAATAVRMPVEFAMSDLWLTVFRSCCCCRFIGSGTDDIAYECGIRFTILNEKYNIVLNFNVIITISNIYKYKLSFY